MFEYEPDLLTRKQAQELLHVGKNTILNCKRKIIRRIARFQNIPHNQL